MAKRRRSIPLQPHEDALLRKMYRLWRIPTDQYDKRPERKTAFVRAWNFDIGINTALMNLDLEMALRRGRRP